MKIMLRRSSVGKLMAYVPKKDLEEEVVAHSQCDAGDMLLTLANGWELSIPNCEIPLLLPITVEAKRL